MLIYREWPWCNREKLKMTDPIDIIFYLHPSLQLNPSIKNPRKTIQEEER
jgi:hypothetical protein